ncbi:MAG TPA: ChuX/HutX family heme-like substrate-binding protein [Kofleriaceae bacterium]|jgi:putative hemin transport protein
MDSIEASLGARWQALRTDRPHLRTRDAAGELGVSEVELVATLDHATRLAPDPASLLHALPAVGRCMALTRNEHCVSEVRGTYGEVELGAHAGTVIGDAIDLRVFLDHWRHLYAIDEPERRSIHVFDRTGTAVHKIYLEPSGDAAAWAAIVASRAQPGPLVLEAAPPPRTERPDAEIEREALIAGWDAMTDTHEFFHLLAKHGASRVQALRLAAEDETRPRARRVSDGAIGEVLRGSAASGERIMIFVGNRGCIQVFSGAVARIAPHGPWLNVLDASFNLHLRADRIASSWVVAKPTRSGLVRSLELFDAAGETIALVFRRRDDRDLAEDPAWSAQLDALAGHAS